MRNNYADNDASAKTVVNTTNAEFTIAADPDQFHVIDWITVSNQGNGSLQIVYYDADGTSNDNKVWDATFSGSDLDHVLFGNGLYEADTPKNRLVKITKSAGNMKVCIRYR